MPFNSKNGKEATIRLNSGANVGTESTLNLIEGAGIDLTVVDDAPNKEIDITIASTITQYTDEMAQDAANQLIDDTSTIDWFYDDDANSLTASVIQSAIDHTLISNKGTYTHTQIDAHIDNTSNPHSVTKSQIGLSNVENTALSTWTGSTTITTLGVISTGTIPVARLSGSISLANGGTGLSSTPTNGQLLIGNGSGYTLATLTAGSNVTITNGAGSIQIASSTTAASLYFDDDGGTPTTTPVATGARSVAIGDGASSGTDDSFAIGRKANTTTSAQNFAIGNSLGSIALNYTQAVGNLALAIGNNDAGASVSGAVYTRATGDQSIAIGNNTGTNINSFTVAGGTRDIVIGARAQTNTTAIGSDNIAIGQGARAPGGSSNIKSIAIGSGTPANSGDVTNFGAQASGDYAIAIGNAQATGKGAQATAARSIAIGNSITSTGASASGADSIVIGNDSTDSGIASSIILGKSLTRSSVLSAGNSSFYASGIPQSISFTGTTGTGSASTTINVGTIPTNTGWALEAYIAVARDDLSQSAFFKVESLIVRQVGAASLAGSTVTSLATTDANFTVTASTTGYTLTYTGHASDIAYWKADVKVTILP